MRQSSLVVLSALFLLSSHYTYADNNTSTDRYILVFKPTATHADIHEHLKLLTQTPRQNASQFLVEEATTAYSTIGQFRWASGVFDPATIDQLAHTHQHHFAVDYYIPDVTFSLQEVIQTDPPSWGLDRIDQRTGLNNEFRFPSSQGEGVTIYLLDTGLLTTHNDLQGRAHQGKTIVGNDPSDTNGHGTFVAGVCCGSNYGVAKQANVVSVKTLDNQGNGRLSDLLAGLEWVVEQHIQNGNASKSIVNLSLATNYSQATNDAIEQAISMGIHFTIAAGNYGDDACKYSPGSAQNAVTVGAIDKNDSVSYYSNFGACVDIFAPGTDIVSITSSSNDATDTLTGTSMAAPHVAGVMALLLSENDYTPAQLAMQLKNLSSLISENFVVDTANANKSVIDNAIQMGVRVDTSSTSGQTFVNILYSPPQDNGTVWVYGNDANTAFSSSFFSMWFVSLCITIINSFMVYQ